MIVGSLQNTTNISGSEIVTPRTHSSVTNDLAGTQSRMVVPEFNIGAEIVNNYV